MLGWHYIESDNKQVVFKEGKTSIHSLLMTRSIVKPGDAKTSKDLLDMEVPMESSVVSVSTARSNLNDYFNSSNSYNIIEGVNPITGRPITTSIFNLN